MSTQPSEMCRGRIASLSDPTSLSTSRDLHKYIRSMSVLKPGENGLNIDSFLQLPHRNICPRLRLPEETGSITMMMINDPD